MHIKPSKKALKINSIQFSYREALRAVHGHDIDLKKFKFLLCISTSNAGFLWGQCYFYRYCYKYEVVYG